MFACVVGLVSGVTNLDGFMAAGETIQNLTVVKSSANWAISGLLRSLCHRNEEDRVIISKDL